MRMARLGFAWLPVPHLPPPPNLGGLRAAVASGPGEAVGPRCHQAMMLQLQERVVIALRATRMARAVASHPCCLLLHREFCCLRPGGPACSRSRDPP